MNLGEPFCEVLTCSRNVDKTTGEGKFCGEHSRFLTKSFVRLTIIDRMKDWEAVTDVDNPLSIETIKKELLEWLGISEEKSV